MTFDRPDLRRTLEQKWDELNRSAEFQNKLAKPFFGYAPPTFAKSNIRIFYVGKATAGPLDGENLEEYFGVNYGPFWNFARSLSREHGSSPLANIAWSNLCKIGTVKGNPGQKLANLQHGICVKILRAEIEFLNPSIIVCVAANTLYDEFLYGAIDTSRGMDGFVEEGKGDDVLWIRKPINGYPPILWMKHPQMRSNFYLDSAIKAAKRLIESSARA